MNRAAVIIPNLNGIAYIRGCLDSLAEQSCRDFETVVIDNGSEDGSAQVIEEEYPWVKLKKLSRNTGFCHAVNLGIRMSDAPVVILLNNDTVCRPDFVRELLSGIERHPKAFSCCSSMRRLDKPDLLDDAGDYYCVLGWAFAAGKDREASLYAKERKVFSSCGGASAYRRDYLEKIGLFDEKHFAYLEDIDIGYRARILGYENWYIPSAQVLHAGSASSGSRYNRFKVLHTSRNSIYLIYKNMPLPQILLNFPFLLAGWLIKAVFFARRGYLREYMRGSAAGLSYCRREKKVKFERRNLIHYGTIQAELWLNLFRRFVS